MKNQIEKLQATADKTHVEIVQNHAELINALSIKPQVNNNQKDEELKQSETASAEKHESDQGFSSMFSFLYDLDNLKQKDFYFTEDYQYSIVHPFKYYKEDTAIEEME